MYAIIEPLNPDSIITPGGTQHGDRVLLIACHSYITACDMNNKPVLLIVSADSPIPSAPLAPATTKIVSRSTGNGGFIRAFAGTYPYVVINGAGNDHRETFLPTGVTYSRDERQVYENGNPVANNGWDNVFDAVDAGRLLYVSGYIQDADGAYRRAPLATGCVGLEDACLYAPITFVVNGIRYGGTSFSAPNVASALASVLAIFPETEGEELIRLAKACAVREPNLSGLGRADFACMTVMTDDGQWRVVTAGEFAGLVAPPAAMTSLVFPGAALLRSSFSGPGGAQITLAVKRPGVFSFSSGIPIDPETLQPGFFPVIAGDESANLFGGGYLTNDGFFAMAGYGRRLDFFGLGKAFGYDGGTSLDVEIGHRNFFGRLSRQWATGHLISEAEGTAVGLTATRTFALIPHMTATLAAHADKFTGGHAETAFGNVDIQGGPWNKEAELTLTYDMGRSSSVTLRGNRRFTGFGAVDRLDLDLVHRF